MLLILFYFFSLGIKREWGCTAPSEKALRKQTRIPSFSHGYFVLSPSFLSFSTYLAFFHIFSIVHALFFILVFLGRWIQRAYLFGVFSVALWYSGQRTRYYFYFFTTLLWLPTYIFLPFQISSSLSHLVVYFLKMYSACVVISCVSYQCNWAAFGQRRSLFFS